MTVASLRRKLWEGQTRDTDFGLNFCCHNGLSTSSPELPPQSFVARLRNALHPGDPETRTMLSISYSSAPSLFAWSITSCSLAEVMAFLPPNFATKKESAVGQTVPLENVERSEHAGFILPFRNHPRCLFLSPPYLPPYGRSSVHGPISNSRTWPCATKSTFFAAQRRNDL